MEPQKVLPGTKKGSPMGTAEEPLWNYFVSLWDIDEVSRSYITVAIGYPIQQQSGEGPRMTSNQDEGELQVVTFNIWPLTPRHNVVSWHQDGQQGDKSALIWALHLAAWPKSNSFASNGVGDA